MRPGTTTRADLVAAVRHRYDVVGQYSEPQWTPEPKRARRVAHDPAYPSAFFSPALSCSAWADLGLLGVGST